MVIIAIAAGVVAVAGAISAIHNGLEAFDRSVVLSVYNNTNSALEIMPEHTKHEHGNWDEPAPPVIPPHSVAVFSSKDIGVATGTEGKVTYGSPSLVNSVWFYWNNPFVGSNDCNAGAVGKWLGGDNFEPPILSTTHQCGGGNTGAKMRYDVFGP